MLTWNWNDKVGTWKEKMGEYSREYTMYKCNGLLVLLDEFKENGKEMYNMGNFFLDKDHLKNCLGLNKGYENMFEEYDIEITVFEHCKQTKTLIENLNKAEFKGNLSISILNRPF